MKRFYSLIVSLILAFSLVACTQAPNRDFNANIVKESINGSTIVVHVVIKENTSDEAALKFIANEIAVEVFNKHKTTIGLDKMTLTIHLFDDKADSNDLTDSLASIVFNINNAANQPGLSPGVFQKK